MLYLIVRWILFALALLFVAWIVPGIAIAGFKAALLVALVMGLINIFIKPILIILTLPINILTLGLFTFIINALLFLFISHVVPGFVVTGFLTALLGSILLSIISMFINRLEF